MMTVLRFFGVMQVHYNPQTFTYISGRGFSQFSSVRVQDGTLLIVPFIIDKIEFWSHCGARFDGGCCQKNSFYNIEPLDLLSSVPVMENVSPILKLGNRKRSDGALGNE